MLRPTGQSELLSGKLRSGFLKEGLKMPKRKEEKASVGWQNGLSQKVSFLPHHLQYPPQPHHRVTPPLMKLSTMHSRLTIFRQFCLLISQIS
jgi:hypothetical protein